MKTKSLIFLCALLTATFTVAAQLPLNLYKNKLALQNNNPAKPFTNLLEVPNSLRKLNLNNSAANCSDELFAFAPTAAPCNGISVTSINFNNASRTVFSGTDKTVGVVYKYANAGTAPDGTVVDAHVKVVSYANNQDASTTTFTDGDVPAATIGFDQNLQPNINQESLVYDNSKTSWTGNIQYQINFYVAGTTTPKVISVAAISIDNDGATQAQNTCGQLQETVTYSSGFNQILIDNTGSTQTVAGAAVTGPFNNQAGVGIGTSFANAALFVNVSQLNWTYAFNLPTMGTAAQCNGASPGRYGSLNMSCQITFDHNFVSFPLSGTVFNDANGLTDSTVNGTGTGTPSGTQLYANLVDGNGFIVSSVAVNADGTYSFPTVVNGTYTVQISTTQGVESSASPAIALPAGWINTGENLGAGAGNDGTINGSLPVTVSGAAVTNANFGIEQPPTANNNTATSQGNPGGTTSATVPAATFSGTDTAPGTVSNIRITAFPSNATTITINGTVYGPVAGPGVTVFPAAGVTVPTNAAGNPTQPILVDPINGAVTVVIPYVTLDNAGVASAAATASVPFVTSSISGNVFNDTNGLSDSIVNGTGTNAGGLFANLLDSGGNVVATVAIPAGGTYSFAGLNGGNYTVQITTNAGTVGSAAPATALPTGWVNTGENIGTAAGNDGAVNGLLPVALGTTSVTNANFGIEQRPTANNNTATAQGNPGGTTSATVPATTFSGADTGTNTVSSIRISAFPTNATTITINGTVYGPVAGPGVTAFPAGGVTVPTNAAGNPTQPILVDPINGAVTVVITYFAVDAAGVESSASATASVPFVTSTISGNVFNDTNGLTDSIVNGTGTNAGGLFANLLDSSGNVVQSVAVPAGGTYSFAGLNGGNYTVQITTNAGTVGSAAPATTLPAGWVNTGENIGTAAGNDGTVNGLLPVVLGTTSITNANFGIEQRPTANNNTATAQTNPGGTVSATVPAGTFTGTDATAVTNIRITSFPSNANSLTVGTTTYYATTLPGTCPTATCALFPAAGVTVPTNATGNPTTAISVDPVNGAVTVVIPYVTVDAAGIESLAATASVPFVTVGISGSVFNDTNGLSDSTVNGTGTNAGGLFANLLDSNGNVVQSVAVPAGGTYSFTGLNSGSYSVQISTNAGTVGSAAPATVLPAGWVNTGEFVGAGAGNDGTVNGLLPVTVGATSITNANFGIEQRPTANNNTAASQLNQGGTVNATVPATTFSATDPVTNTVSSIRITAFPSNATTITINGTTYTSANFPAGGVTVPTNAAGNPTQTITVDPAPLGATTVVIRYVAIDAAGFESSTPANANVPFNISPTAGSALIGGKLVSGDTPLRGVLVVLHNTTTNQKQVVRTDANGTFGFEEEVGTNYIIEPLSNKYSFSPSTKLVSLVDDVANENFFGTAKTYRPKNDFDGDGKTDYAVYRASEGNWYIWNSSESKMSVFHFGIETDVPVAGDFDGDGKADYAVYRASEGNWYIWQSASQSLRVDRFGLADDKLVPADFDGDGKTDVAVYRDGVWYIKDSANGAVEIRNFGLATDKPAVEDFDGDGKADISVYRPSDLKWYAINSSTNNWTVFRFGLATDVPVAADYDGDGFADIAQFRKGIWYVQATTTDFRAEQFGQEDDRSFVGDFDGDGRADLTVYSGGVWAVHRSGNGAVEYFNFGLPTDTLIK